MAISSADKVSAPPLVGTGLSSMLPMLTRTQRSTLISASSGALIQAISIDPADRAKAHAADRAG
jgi:hypothetical protein